jgi:hypothetical protein
VSAELLEVGRVRHPEEAAAVRVDGVEIPLPLTRLAAEDDLLAVR